MTTDEILALITAHYLESSDFNGFPIRELSASQGELVKLLGGLIEAELISSSLGSVHPNPYIKAFLRRQFRRSCRR